MEKKTMYILWKFLEVSL